MCQTRAISCGCSSILGRGTSRLDTGRALVLSPASYNGKTGLMVCCPLTTKIKGYPFEVVMSDYPPAVALADQLKNLDWRARGATRRGRATAAELADVRAKARAVIGI